MGTKHFYVGDRRANHVTPVAVGSIADKPHEHKREIARYDRQKLAIFARNIKAAG